MKLLLSIVKLLKVMCYTVNDIIAKFKNFLSDLKDVTIILLSLVASVFAALFFFEKKKDVVQKELTQEATVTAKVDNINTQIANTTLQEKEQEDAPVTTSDLLDFLNKPK